jgi:hypothetical protein
MPDACPQVTEGIRAHADILACDLPTEEKEVMVSFPLAYMIQTFSLLHFKVNLLYIVLLFFICIPLSSS